MADFKIGLQLYSVNDYMAKDVEETIKAVAEMGYECIEFAGYYDKTAKELKEICEKYNIIPISTHQTHRSILEDLEGLANYLKDIGIKYCVVPAVWPEDMDEDYDKLIADFKNISEVMSSKGIKLVFHNHTDEFFVKHGEEVFLDKFFKDLEGYCIPELDVGWAHYAGVNPLEYIEKYKDREEIIQLADFDCKNLPAGNIYDLDDGKGFKYNIKRNRDDDGYESKPIGCGRENIKKILEAIEKTNIKYVIVENEVWHTEPGDPETTLGDAKKSIDYIKSIGY